MTAAESLELGRIAAASGVFVMEAMWMKFTPAMQRAVELVDAGTIGEPRFVQAGLGYPVGKNGPARFWDPALGGGALYDMAVYTITVADLFLGEVAEISATGTVQPDGVDLEEAITLRFTSGALAQLATSITTFVPPRGWLGGTKGAIDFGEQLFSPGSIRVATGTPPTPPTIVDEVFEKEGNGYVPMFRAVNDSILAGDTENPQHPVSATARVLGIMEAIQQKLFEDRDARG
jgi:predicted dehydrogenase